MFEILFKTACKHDKVTLGMKAGYCPDCGDYVENHWYISRCECCGFKQKSLVRFGRVITDAKFCRNCGSSSFIYEKLENLDIVSVNYAVSLKRVVATKRKNVIQTWIDENSYTPIKLLPVY